MKRTQFQTFFRNLMKEKALECWIEKKEKQEQKQINIQLKVKENLLPYEESLSISNNFCSKTPYGTY